MLSPDVDIICFALSRWDAPISSPSLSLAKELSKNHRVFYIDHPFSWKDVILEFNSKAVKARRPAWFGQVTSGNDWFGQVASWNDGPGKKKPYHPDEIHPNLIYVTPPLTIPVNFLPEGKLYDQLFSFNQKLMEKFLAGIIRDHHIQEYIFINFFDPFFFTRMSSIHSPKTSDEGGALMKSGISSRFPLPLVFVYQSMDEISEVSYTAKHGVRLEREMVQRADLTICTSRGLTAKYKGIGGRVEYFPNAVDFELFKKAFFETLPIPEELKKFKHSRIIGFTGSVDYRTDFNLLRRAAESFPDLIFFFVGPLITVEHQRYGLHDLPNVVFFPARPIHELPAFLQHTDVLIIPYKINTLTNAIYPLKINEYLSSGKPVVTTNFSEDIRSFGELVYLADNESQFIEGLRKALQETDKDLQRQRVECAARNSWKHRADQLRSLLCAIK